MRINLAFTLPFCACALFLSPGFRAPVGGEQPGAAHETRIPVGGAQLYARDIGQGKAIIVLHGGPDFDQSYLLPEMDRLADSYHLIYYDQRGRGRSGEGVKPEDVTLASEMADLEKVRQYYQLESLVLLGHSWGSVLALEYALRYPERVSHMILMDPGPASSGDYKQLRKDWLEKRAADMERRKAIAESAGYKEGDPDAVAAYYRIHFKPALVRQEDFEKLIARLRASFTKEGILRSRAIESRLMTETWSLPDYDLLPKLKHLNIPTLVMYGDHDFIPAGSAEHIAAAIPNARMVTLKNCGHFPYMECPVPTREGIDAFFAANAGRR